MTDESPFKEYISVVQDVPPDPTPERLAQRDRLALLLHEDCTELWDRLGASAASNITQHSADAHYDRAARLIAADVRVGPDEGPEDLCECQTGTQEEHDAALEGSAE